jgi:DNA invertase Pin-like site-specific DNA recombinase
MEMISGTSVKVQARHLDRKAFLYVRQSTMRQVMTNRESGARQYALQEQALALGWAAEDVIVIDRDQGQTAVAVADRAGFQQLEAEVGMGRAGLVIGLEVSRLARNSSDWYRLLDLCALHGTLILDEDALYDPRTFNDRMVLGLKGTMSEAEHYMICARLQGGLMNKARRGELRIRLPVGFVYDDDDRVLLDPDTRVQASIRTLFTTYRRLHSAHRTATYFRSEGLQFPTRLHAGPHMGELIWGTLLPRRVFEVLKNPRYAGAFAFGRRSQQLEKTGGGVAMRHQPREQWIALLPDAHAGYITWEMFEEHQRILRENARATKETRRCPPREGPALLQGLAVCGVCGRRLTVRYYTRGDELLPTYTCQGPAAGQTGQRCQNVRGAGIDAAISRIMVEVMTPLNVHVAMAVQDELETRMEEVDRMRLLRVEQARHEVDLARRRYQRVDPDNRLVAASLEADWNDKLRALRDVEEEYARRRQDDRLEIDAMARARLQNLTDDFARVWNDPRTAARDRKRMVRLVIEDVTITKGERLTLGVRFRGGTTRTLEIPRPLTSWESWRQPAEVVQEIDRLLDHHTCRAIADILNEKGLRSGTGKSFDGMRVRRTVKAHGLRSRRKRLATQGLITIRQLAAKLGLTPSGVRARRREGRLEVRAYLLDDTGQYMYEDPDRPTSGQGGCPSR